MGLGPITAFRTAEDGEHAKVEMVCSSASFGFSAVAGGVMHRESVV